MDDDRVIESVIRIETQLGDLIQRIDRQTNALQECVNDHEDRILAIEKQTNTIIGKLAIIGTVVLASVGAAFAAGATYIFGRT